MHAQDPNFYPKKFRSFKVTTRDGDNNPTRTEYYKDEAQTQIVFVWIQSWLVGHDKLDSWKVTEIAQ